jgi:hypothetical protein
MSGGCQLSALGFSKNAEKTSEAPADSWKLMADG